MENNLLLNICREWYHFQKRRLIKWACPLLPVFLSLPSLCLSLSGCCRVDWRFCHACFDRPGRAQVPTVWQLSSNPAAYYCTNALALTHTYIHTHTWPACQYVRDGETGCLCFPSPYLSPSLHICVFLSRSLISRVRFRGEEGVKLRRLLTFPSNIQSILSHSGPELTHTCTHAP